MSASRWLGILVVVVALLVGCSSAPDEAAQRETASELVDAWCDENVEHPHAGAVAIELGEGSADDRRCLAKLRVPDPVTPGGWSFFKFEFRLDLRPASPRVIDVAFDPAMMEKTRRQAAQIEAEAERARRNLEIIRRTESDGDGR